MATSTAHMMHVTPTTRFVSIFDGFNRSSGSHTVNSVVFVMVLMLHVPPNKSCNDTSKSVNPTKSAGSSSVTLDAPRDATLTPFAV